MRLLIVVAAALAAFPAELRAERFVLVGSWASGDVRRYRLDGTLVDTFIPGGSGGLGFPDGLAYGADGNLYVSDAGHAKVLRYNGSTGAFMDVFVGTDLTRAGYCAFGPEGDLYVCSNGDNAVHRFDPATGAHIDAFAATPGLAYPAGLAWKGGSLYVCGFGSNSVGRFNAATGAFEGNVAGPFNRPLYARVGSSGDLSVCDYGSNRLDQVALPDGPVVGHIGGGGLSGPVGQAVLPDGTLLVTSWNSGRILKYDEVTGAFLGVFASGYAQANDIILTPDILPAPGGAVVWMAAVGVVSARRRRPGPSFHFDAPESRCFSAACRSVQ